MSMPTGYTADVQDGKITTLDQFAWRCARAFGACVEMRDDPQTAKIPERFEPNTDYHDKEIAAALAEIARLNDMKPVESDAAAKAAYRVRAQANAEYAREKAEQKLRYQAMLKKVRAWMVDKEIDGLRKFMIEQLESSIEFDCSDSGFEAPEKLSGADWLDRSLVEARRELAYHKVARGKEIQRVAGRNAWLAQLRADLLVTA